MECSSIPNHNDTQICFSDAFNRSFCTMSLTHPVLIVGAGMGGLCLAHGLKKARIPFRVFERDPTPDFRPQGYRVRISPDGAAALHACLSPSRWERLQLACAALPDKMLKVDPLPNEPDSMSINPPVPRPKHEGFTSLTADRIVTRNVLLGELEDHIEWDKDLRSTSTNESTITAIFADGTEATGSLLVGADGVRSAVRRLHFPTNIPVDTQGRAIYGKTILTPDVEVKVAAQILNATCLSQDNRQEKVLSFFTEPIRFPRGNGVEHPPDYIYWVLLAQSSMFPLPDGVMDVAHLSSDQAANLSREITKTWSEKIRAVFEHQDVSQTSGLRICSVHPDRMTWDPVDRVVLLGDAAHVAPPAGGQGANLALQDADALVRSLVESRPESSGEESERVWIQVAATKYEEAMRQEAISAVRMSLMGGSRFFDQRPWDECEDAVF
jgi:2-polyprenyl-6-methoxyphenol hydroxylase-like FAD-dependent oxidoreductase